LAQKKKTGRIIEDVTYDEILEAIKDSNGVKANICRKLDVNRDDLDFFIRKYSTLARAIEWERENAIDNAINKLIERVEAKDQKAIEFFLRAQGKERGYGEVSDVNVKGKINHQLDWSEATKMLLKMKEQKALKPKKEKIIEGVVIESEEGVSSK
jgi:hypothetical protein